MPSTLLGIVNTSNPEGQLSRGPFIRFYRVFSSAPWLPPRAQGGSGSRANLWLPRRKLYSGLLFRKYWGGPHAGVAGRRGAASRAGNHVCLDSHAGLKQPYD